MITIHKIQIFFLQIKKKRDFTFFFYEVTTYESYLRIFVQLSPALTLLDVHHGRTANQNLDILCVCVYVCVWTGKIWLYLH